MQVIPLTYPLETGQDTFGPVRQVLAIGDFDGVHLGHREVISRALRTAQGAHFPASIMTFHPHPREVLGQDKYVQLLTPLHRKMDVFRELGVQHTYVVTFNESLMKLSPEQFVSEVLNPLGVETVIVGFDFTFGHKGLGNPDALCELSRGKFAVEVVRPYHIDGVKVSSTSIREALQEGQVETASRLLGRRYIIRGTVVGGHRRGRMIGFPTANIDPDEAYVVPAHGVYAVIAHFRGQTRHGVMNIGVKPTFETGELQPTLEAHLFDFEGDIYGETVTVELVAYLRKEQKFASMDELVVQIRQDAEAAKAMLYHLK